MSTSLPPDPQTEARQDDARSDTEALAAHDVLRLRAPNPGPYTLSGTNTWLVGRTPAWVVDPGPLIDAHVRRLLAAIDARGGLGGIALTHRHRDHCEALAEVLRARPAPLAAAAGEADVVLGAGVRFGPFEAVPTPGHSADHFALLADGACFSGDAVLGEGSVFISPHPGAMSGYLASLRSLAARDELSVLCPGHGPPVWDVQGKLAQYLQHRLDRERSLIAALGEDRRTVEELLDAVWADVPAALRPAATLTLAAHLDKLEDERRLPAGVERPSLQGAQR